MSTTAAAAATTPCGALTTHHQQATKAAATKPSLSRGPAASYAPHGLRTARHHPQRIVDATAVAMRRSEARSVGGRSWRVAAACCLLNAPSAVTGFQHFYYPNFQNRPHLNLNGDAASLVNELHLTLSKPHQAGAVWFDVPVDVESGFETAFAFRVSEVENGGAEGFAFVLHSSGPYTIGEADAGIGYEGLRDGIAIEFDTVESKSKNDPPGPHVSIHENLEAQLTARESRINRQRAMLKDFLTYDENPSNLDFPRVIDIRYFATNGELRVDMETPSKDPKDHKVETLLRYQVGRIRGTFYVGFTATTGSSYAKFSLLSWRFKAAGRNETIAALDHKCTPGFDGRACAMTNEVAHKECPRRKSCDVCVEDVYNCAWCTASSGDKCVVGTQEDIRECSSLALEPLNCAAGLSRIWLYMLGVAALVVVVFGVLLFKTLPLVQSFRAISILVALVVGALTGMFVSLLISVSLVEISETPAFAVLYGIFFLVEFGLLVLHIRGYELPQRGPWSAHVVLLSCCAGFVLISGLSCILLDRSFIHWLPEGLKVLFYTILGATLNFCLVFSVAELINEISKRCCQDDRHKNIQSSTQAEASNGPIRISVMESQARISLLAASSVLSGMFFGFMFGTLRIEEESKYRMALALQQETAYTYPMGALIGGVSSVLYQLIQLPLASDETIDRLMRSNDGL